MQKYESKLLQWESIASIRSRPRRIVKEINDECKNYLPISKQPACAHPLVEKRGDEVKQYLLTQSLYKYMNDIANIETEMINDVAHKVYKNRYKIKFPFDIRLDALSIYIDECYHAFVACDYMNQVEEVTGIKQTALPEEMMLSKAIKLSFPKIPEEHREIFKLFCICLAEHVLTTDLITVGKAKGVHKSFFYIMHDHALDEKRHSKIFSFIFKETWQSLSEEEKNYIGPTLISFSNLYLDDEIEKNFLKQILKEKDFSEREITSIIEDTFVETSNESNIIVSQLYQLLDKADVLDHMATKEAFENTFPDYKIDGGSHEGA